MAFKFDSFRSKDYLEHLEVCQDILEDMLDQKSDKTPNWKGQSQVDNIKMTGVCCVFNASERKNVSKAEFYLNKDFYQVFGFWKLSKTYSRVLISMVMIRSHGNRPRNKL